VRKFLAGDASASRPRRFAEPVPHNMPLIPPTTDPPVFGQTKPNAQVLAHLNVDVNPEIPAVALKQVERSRGCVWLREGRFCPLEAQLESGLQ
jgi:hypothetical protein